MKIRNLIPLSLLSLSACQPSTLPTPVPNIFITQNQGSNQNQNGSSTTQPGCSGVVTSIQASIVSGTFSGGKGHVNEPILFSTSTIPNLPATCASASPSVTAAGVCTVPAGFIPSLGSSAVMPNSVGLCVVAVTFDGKSTSFTVDVVS